MNEETEWAVMWTYRSGETMEEAVEDESTARLHVKLWRGQGAAPTVVRRTVTYSEWEQA